jgi:hypothetical protein
MNNMDYSKITLGELLSSPDDIIKRNAVSILKRYQNAGICKIHKNDYLEVHKLTGEKSCRACIIQKHVFTS